MSNNSLPEAERLIEFSEIDFRENLNVTSFSESLVTKSEWEKFKDDALVITDNRNIFQYAEEFPIVIYRCNQYVEVFPTPRLNAFIESITVSAACEGKRFSLKKRGMAGKYTGPDVVAYFTDNTGRNFAIQQEDIFKFLLKKPNLVISQQGLLVFFTEKDILVTVDCEHYAWVKDIDTENSIIKSIDVCSNYCAVNLEDTENPETHLSPYKLQFVVDMSSSGMIYPKATKLEE